MWTNESRHRYDRSKLRYTSNLTDAEWVLIETLIPPAKRGGNKRTVDVRTVVNGLLYILSSGCQWRALPKNLRRAARSATISAGGRTTAHSTASTTRLT